MANWLSKTEAEKEALQRDFIFLYEPHLVKPPANVIIPDFTNRQDFMATCIQAFYDLRGRGLNVALSFTGLNVAMLNAMAPGAAGSSETSEASEATHLD